MEGRNHKRLEYRKELIAGVLLCGRWRVLLERYISWTSNETQISHFVDHHLPVQLEWDVQRSQTAGHFKHLCALILTDRKQQQDGVQGASGGSDHVQLCAGPLPDSGAAAQLQLPGDSQQPPRRVQDRGQRLCSADARTQLTCPS